MPLAHFMKTLLPLINQLRCAKWTTPLQSLASSRGAVQLGMRICSLKRLSGYRSKGDGSWLTANAVVYSGVTSEAGARQQHGYRAETKIGLDLTLCDLGILYTNNHWSSTFSRGDQVGLGRSPKWTYPHRWRSERYLKNM